MRRLIQRDVARERMDRGEPRIAGAMAVLTRTLQVLEKFRDQCRREIVHCQRRWGTPAVVRQIAQQEAKRVAIRGDRMGARLALLQQVVGKKPLEQCRERGGDHRPPSARGFSRRAAASWRSSGTAWRYQ